MTVKDLIEALSQVPGDLPVVRDEVSVPHIKIRDSLIILVEENGAQLIC